MLHPNECIETIPEAFNWHHLQLIRQNFLYVFGSFYIFTTKLDFNI